MGISQTMERYGILLRPHPNTRYMQELRRLALAEFALPWKGDAPQTAYEEINGLELLCFSTAQPLPAGLEQLSFLQCLFRIHEGWLKPALLPGAAVFGDDLPHILKYKGKTNEAFTAMLLNAALFASDFAPDEALTVFDPMCGRGTGLFTAINRGYHAIGIETDKKDIQELTGFFERYLKQGRFKHKRTDSVITQGKRRYGTRHVFDMFEGAGPQLIAACGDTRDAGMFYRKGAAHLLIADLPYGIQHEGRQGGLLELLGEAVPVWRAVLKPGGVMALAFNESTLPRRALMEALGPAWEICKGEPWDTGFSHWVEQGVRRDIVVCKKT